MNGTDLIDEDGIGICTIVDGKFAVIHVRQGKLVTIVYGEDAGLVRLILVSAVDERHRKALSVYQ